MTKAKAVRMEVVSVNLFKNCAIIISHEKSPLNLYLSEYYFS